MKNKSILERFQYAIWTDSGETYIDTGVKMLLAIVIGALLLTGIYGIFQDVILENVSGTIESFFDQTLDLNGAGGSGGGGGQQQQTITFTAFGVEYQSLEGMTWGEWCNSSYNSDGYYLYDSSDPASRVKSPEDRTFVLSDTSSYIRANDVIVANGVYEAGHPA